MKNMRVSRASLIDSYKYDKERICIAERKSCKIYKKEVEHLT